MYGRREPPQEPPCHQCRVDLSPENDIDAAVYMMTRRQVVTAGMSGQIVDISITAVKIAMDLLGVKDQVACLNRVRKLFHNFLEKSDD
jgi:hypothetical protein